MTAAEYFEAQKRREAKHRAACQWIADAIRMRINSELPPLEFRDEVLRTHVAFRHAAVVPLTEMQAEVQEAPTP
jgi:hypothetical protein